MFCRVLCRLFVLETSGNINRLCRSVLMDIGPALREEEGTPNGLCKSWGLILVVQMRCSWARIRGRIYCFLPYIFFVEATEIALFVTFALPLMWCSRTLITRVSLSFLCPSGALANRVSSVEWIMSLKHLIHFDSFAFLVYFSPDKIEKQIMMLISDFVCYRKDFAI